ncbi:Ku protein [Streptomyces sp. NPDC056534]|uniref:non-homologous end joining protein Ku n=1 Tax=Streptomyces sp. NPDC056534 TaxID=3345857 RepID=UPI0036C87D0E
MKVAWKGIISLGLVKVPVHLYRATGEHGIQLRQIHETDGGIVKQKRFCESEQKEIPYQEVSKGYEVAPGVVVKLTQEDLSALRTPSEKKIEIFSFINLSRIDPLMFSAAYYIGPSGRPAVKPYTLLRSALKDARKVAVTKVTLWSRETPAIVRIHADVLLLHTLHWPDEIRPTLGIAPAVEESVTKKEIDEAKLLVEELSRDFDLRSLEDEYQERLQRVISARLQGLEVSYAGSASAPSVGEIDLSPLLEESVQRARRINKASREDSGRRRKKL